MDWLKRCWRHVPFVQVVESSRGVRVACITNWWLMSLSQDVYIPRSIVLHTQLSSLPSRGLPWMVSKKHGCLHIELHRALWL
jgi:hypothetical protein